MLVDVVRLRRDGKKIPQAELPFLPRMRGDLCLWRRPDRYARPPSVIPVAFLNPPGETQSRHVHHLLPPLDYAKLTALRGDTFVVSGIEDVTPARQKDLVLHRQSWWCILVKDSSRQRPARDDPARVANAGKTAQTQPG